MGSNQKLIIKIKKILRSVFKIKDLGELKYFLGMELKRTNRGLFLNQKKYIKVLFEEIGMSKANPTKTPIEAKLKLSCEEGEPVMKSSFQKLVGSHRTKLNSNAHRTKLNPFNTSNLWPL